MQEGRERRHWRGHWGGVGEAAEGVKVRVRGRVRRAKNKKRAVK